MTSKFSWEPLDGGSLLLKVADGDRETTWKITKRTSTNRISAVMYEVSAALYARKEYMQEQPKPLRELVRTVDDVEMAELREDAEKASRAAQQAAVDKLSRKAQWWDNDDDEDDAFVAQLPDYDSGEIK